MRTTLPGIAGIAAVCFIVAWAGLVTLNCYADPGSPGSFP